MTWLLQYLLEIHIQNKHYIHYMKIHNHALTIKNNMLYTVQCNTQYDLGQKYELLCFLIYLHPSQN